PLLIRQRKPRLTFFRSGIRTLVLLGHLLELGGQILESLQLGERSLQLPSKRLGGVAQLVGFCLALRVNCPRPRQRLLLWLEYGAEVIQLLFGKPAGKARLGWLLKRVPCRTADRRGQHHGVIGRRRGGRRARRRAALG